MSDFWRLLLTVVVVVWLASAVVAAGILSQAGRAGTGALLGLVLGPFGVAMAWRQRHGGRVACRECRELIDPRATICPHCRSPVSARR